VDTLRKVISICERFPEVAKEKSGSHMTFRVRKKVFAYYLDNHHGDGIVSVCCKTSLGENFDLARSHSDRYYIPAYIGPRGWVGLRLDAGKIDWSEVSSLITTSYKAVAPKRLAAGV
jgi:phosphoribosylglycinamide formyltransferase-1